MAKANTCHYCGGPTMRICRVCDSCIVAVAKRTCEEQGKEFPITDPVLLRQLSILVHPERISRRGRAA